MKRILVIDDDDAFLMTVSAGLTSFGYECITANGGRKGVAAALEHLPDLVVCDIYMGEENGFETLEAFRSHEQLMPVPFIFLTGRNEQGVARHGMDLGADDFLFKPVEFAELTAAIDARLERVRTLTTEGSRNIERMRDHLEEIRKLSEVTQRINAGVLLEDVCEQIYASFRPIIPFNRIGLALIDDTKGTVTAHWARSDSQNIRITKGYTQALQGSSLEGILASKRPRIINDLEEYAVQKPSSHSTKDVLEEGVRSSLTCPLIAMGKDIGFLFFSSFQKNTYKNEHVEIYLQLAGQLSIVLEKARLYQQLIDLNAMKNKFMGIAAHDLRNPLGAIIGFADLLKDEEAVRSSADLLESVEFIAAAGASALHLINDLLDFAAIESGHLTIVKEPVHVHTFLNAALKTHQLFARNKNISITAEVAADVPEETVFDRQRIRQVLDNFLSNAVKYSNAGTAVTVHLTRRGDRLHCAVTDQGQGIPEEEVKQLFKEYSRTSVLPTGGEKSTGLGLAIAKKIVKEHGGDVGATSTVGIGSTFFFEIPILK